MNDLVATRYAASMQALDLGFRARLTNSGMAAIDTAVRVAVGRIAKKTPDGARIVHASELYPETPKLLEEYATMTNGACLKFSGGGAVGRRAAVGRRPLLHGDGRQSPPDARPEPGADAQAVLELQWNSHTGQHDPIVSAAQPVHDLRTAARDAGRPGKCRWS